uniref:Sema domain-containing protein n=1 Tax=Callorhinchus milii TaxID=7868 RepID=A0A4W3GLL9_CALMI
MFTATLYEFRGTVADIKTNLYQRSLRTNDALPRWLSGADFVESTLVRESANSLVGDDDKIYFFFTENLSEEMYTYDGLPMVTRVARVCKVRYCGEGASPYLCDLLIPY